MCEHYMSTARKPLLTCTKLERAMRVCVDSRMRAGPDTHCNNQIGNVIERRTGR